MKQPSRLALLAAAVLAIWSGVPALADGPPAPPPALRFVPIAPADGPGTIALRPAPVPAGLPEEWLLAPGNLTIVRNVTVPTLTPVLPAKGTATGAAVIIAPGGGFVSLAIEHEGYAVARELAAHGIAAFVLKYRVEPAPRDPALAMKAAVDAGRRLLPKADEPVAGTPEGLADAQAAIAYVRENAARFGIARDRVGLLGFSAGAIITVSAGLDPAKERRPDFIGVIYGSLNPRPVPTDAPPMFAAIALDDPLFGKGRSLGLIEGWRAAKRPVEAHLYEKGGHGFGMRPASAGSALWIEAFRAWLKDRGMLAAPPAGASE